MSTILANLKNQSYRRIYLTWGLILITGFLLSGYGVGSGYWHWFPLIIIGLAVQAQAGLQPKEAKILIVLWGLLTWLGVYYTLLVMQGALRPDTTYFPHIGMLWLCLLGVMQIVTGTLAKQRLEWALGIIWIIVAIIFRNTSLDILPSFALLAAITGVPYLYFALKK